MSPTNADQTVKTGNTGVAFAKATDPITKLPISEATCVVDFFAPGKDPEHNVNERAVDFTFPGNYDERVTGYLCYFTTSGSWTAGVWTYRVTLTSAYEYSQYANFTLEP